MSSDDQPGRWLTAPALWDPGWIPPDELQPWPELAELRTTHLRLREASGRAADDVRRAEGALEAFRRERQEALVQSYRDGREPKLSGADHARSRELEEAVSTARERSGAVLAATVEFLAEATATITERCPQWLDDLRADLAERRRAVQAAQRALDEARANVAANKRLIYWVDRTGRTAAQPGHLPDHISYAALTGNPDDALIEQVLSMQPTTVRS
jgi:hypothetical protein